MSLLQSIRSVPARRLPPRMYLYAREKFGKSSFGAQFPKPIFFMSKGETGLLELIDSGRIGPTPHFPYDANDPPTFGSLMSAIQALATEKHDFETLVIDTANGAEALCVDLVRNRDYGGDQKKFASYGKGWDSCRPVWSDFLAALDSLRTNRNMGILMLAHTKRKKFNDPTGDDFDKYMPECAEKLWDLTHKWADIICFGRFESTKYETDDGRTKARNMPDRRLLCFEQSPLWDAGNRYGLTGSISVDGGAAKAYRDFATALNAARGKSASVAEPSDAEVVDGFIAELWKVESQEDYDRVKDRIKACPLRFNPANLKRLTDTVLETKQRVAGSAATMPAPDSDPVPDSQPVTEVQA